MKRSFEILCSLCVVAILACSFNVQDQSGVTSTGNSGELAGLVYDGQSVALARQNGFAANPHLADSAKVILFDSKHIPLDSQYTNSDGSFLFRNLERGNYRVVAIFRGDSSVLSMVNLQAGQRYAAQMMIGGQSGPAPVGEQAISLYSSNEGQVEQNVWLTFLENAAQAEVQVQRISGKDTLRGNWMFTFQNMGLQLRDSAQAGCSKGGLFFSTLSGQIQDNNWFYNGDLRGDYGAGDVCGNALPTLPEMQQLNMGGLELLFGRSKLQAKFYESKWCFTRDVSQTLWNLDTISNHNVEVVDCNSLRIISMKPDTVTIRTLWFDPGEAAVSEELSHNGSSCIYTGKVVNQATDPCSVAKILR